MKVSRYPKAAEWAALQLRPLIESAAIARQVKPIMAQVKQDGDRALKHFSQKFDGLSLDYFPVSRRRQQTSAEKISDALREAILRAKTNIEKFHLLQREPVKKVEILEGVRCWRKSVPIEKVGLYVPGGTAPLFSTVLMLGIPAKLAGCTEIILCTPPGKNGEVHPAILFAANSIGITQIFRVGGAQAIAAMTYGTETIPATYKIFGPGNQYVTAAKQIAQQEGVAIDMPAGPSELLVMADQTANPAFIAADLLSQAEHGTDSQVIFVSLSSQLVEQVQQAITEQIGHLPRKEIAEKSLAHSRIILLENRNKAIDFANQYAPEHLIIAMHDAHEIGNRVINAGSVFLGNYTPESAGDYASGTNHTLPTNGFARNHSGVSLDSFLKKITFQEITPHGLQRIGNTIETMAEHEQLIAHKNAVSLRLKAIQEKEN